MNKMKWQLRQPISDDDQKNFPSTDRIMLQLLFNRGLHSISAIDSFLKPSYDHDLHDPFLFKDMEQAASRILDAVAKGEQITVYGDYDADGVCSSVIVVETLKALGAIVDIYIPYRETEGYGLNLTAVEQLAKQGTTLVITVDCGISNAKEIAFLQSNGVDVIVTDHHHQPLTLPAAFAIINPNVTGQGYPFASLAGCGVAFKLAQALVLRHENFSVKKLSSGWEKWLLDLVAIGTIADMQPLIDENRILVSYGLRVLQKTRRIGIKELIRSASQNNTIIDERVVGWQISPRLNAAGRLNHASVAYRLLITQDAEQAVALAAELNATNTERQQLTERMTAEAKQNIGDVEGKSLLIAVGTDWPTGVVGLVAGRIMDEFQRPCLIISHYKGQIIGSGRSPAEFNIIEAIQQADDCLSRYGGHGQACGFTIKDETSLVQFIEKMNQIASRQLTDAVKQPVLEIDAEVQLEAITPKLQSELGKFSPYGEGNGKPRFLANELKIVELQSVGRDHQHLRLMVKHQSHLIHKTIGFSFGQLRDKLKPGDTIDMVFEVDTTIWNGQKELQLKIIDINAHE